MQSEARCVMMRGPPSIAFRPLPQTKDVVNQCLGFGYGADSGTQTSGKLQALVYDIRHPPYYDDQLMLNVLTCELTY